MENQNRKEALRNAGGIIGRTGLVVIVFFVLMSFKSKNEIGTQRESVEPASIVQSIPMVYESYNYVDVARDKDGMAGKSIEIEGKVIQSTSSWGDVVLRVATAGDYDEIYYVTIPEDSLDFNVLDDDYVTVKGMLAGIEKYNSVLGGQVSIPKIEADEITLQ